MPAARRFGFKEIGETGEESKPFAVAACAPVFGGGCGSSSYGASGGAANIHKPIRPGKGASRARVYYSAGNPALHDDIAFLVGLENASAESVISIWFITTLEPLPPSRRHGACQCSCPVTLS